MNAARALDILEARYPKRRAFVTGAASGLGRSLALRLGMSGWTLGLNDIDAQGLDDVALAVTAAGGPKPELFVFDVADADAFGAAAAAFLEHGRGADLLFNNAGIGCGGLFLDTPLADWREVLDVNVLGVVNGARAFVPAFLRQRSGHVVNVASAAAFLRSPSSRPTRPPKRLSPRCPRRFARSSPAPECMSRSR